MSNYAMFYEDDVPESLKVIEKVADRFDIYVTDVDIWDVAREHQEPPHLGNIYMDILFGRLNQKIQEKYPSIECDYEVNGLASYFNINSERLESIEQLEKLAHQ